ncbi:MAG: histidine kinase [Bacteroidia bacterium]|nr:histidine kinase [Bacteroidia bacterium]
MAQSEYDIRYDEDDGLVQNAIYALDQDANGFVWIGTDFGLYRFDGVEFKHYGMNEGLSDHEVLGLATLDEGVVVMATFSGKIDFLYRDTVFNASRCSRPELMMVRGIPKMKKYSSNSFILGSNKQSDIKLLKFDGSDVELVGELVIPDSGMTISMDVSENYIHITAGYEEEMRYFRYSRKNLELTTWERLSEPGPSILALNDSTVLVKHTAELTSYRVRNNGLDLLYNLPSKRVQNLDLGWSNSAIVSTVHGVNEVRDGRVIRKLLENKRSNASLMDRDSNLWTGTEGDGLFVMRRTGVKQVSGPTDRLKSNVTCISGNDDFTIVGYDNLQVDIYSQNDKQTFNLVEPGTPEFNARVRDIRLTDQGKWYAATDHSLFEVMPDGRRRSIGSEYAFKVLEYHQGRLLVGTNIGLATYWGSGKLDIPWDHRVTALAVDPDGGLWVGHKEGLGFVAPGEEEKPCSGMLSQVRINDLIATENRLFVATNSGIFVRDKSSGKTINLKRNINRVCHKMFLSGSVLWVATHSGLSKISMDSDGRYAVRTFTTQDGLASNVVNDVYVQNDKIWVGTNRGLNTFIESELQRPEIPMTQIVRLQSGNQDLSIYQPLTLKKDQRDLTIWFSTPVFGRKISYKYRLKPAVNHWSETENKAITFSQLKPGDYQFEVIAGDQNGVEGGQIARLNFTVLPHLYQRTGFQAVSWILGIGLLAFLIDRLNRRSRRKELEQNRLEKELASLELDAIKAQIKPHFIYNCLNSIKYSIIQHRNQDAEEQLSVFARLMRRTLDYSSLDFISIEEEISFLREYLTMEKLRFKKQLKFKLECEIESPGTRYIPSMLIQPFVENAVVHGMNNDQKISRLKISFREIGDRIICEILDSGQGFSYDQLPSNEKPSGLSISTTRAESYNVLYGTDVTVNLQDMSKIDTTQTGTLVVLDMPIRTQRKLNHENLHY